MATIGIVGVGKIGMPISENLINSGHRVVGYRRCSLAEFEKIGGVPARSAADVGAQADIVLSCLPSTAALDDVVQRAARARAFGAAGADRGRARLASGAGQATPDRAAREKGAVFIDGEVSGTPGMVAARKGVVYLAGDAVACKTDRGGDRGLRRFLPLFRRVRRREPRQARQ